MKFTFLGTGGAFDYEYGNSAAVVEFKDHTILLDCGFTVYPALCQFNLTDKVEYILLTHLHNDHSGSLANFLLHSHYYTPDQKPIILYPDDDFREEIYEFLRLQMQKPERYVDFTPISEFPGISALDTYGLHADNLQTYAYLFEDTHQRVVYTGDLAQPETLFTLLRSMPPKATTVFHDITFSSKNTTHTYYKRLMSVSREYRIYGYHCNPEENPADNPFPLVYHHPELMFSSVYQTTNS